MCNRVTRQRSPLTCPPPRDPPSHHVRARLYRYLCLPSFPGSLAFRSEAPRPAVRTARGPSSRLPGLTDPGTDTPLHSRKSYEQQLHRAVKPIPKRTITGNGRNIASIRGVHFEARCSLVVMASAPRGGGLLRHMRVLSALMAAAALSAKVRGCAHARDHAQRPSSWWELCSSRSVRR